MPSLNLPSRAHSDAASGENVFQLHQTLEMIGNATINGYLQARYLNTFKRHFTQRTFPIFWFNVHARKPL